MYGGNAHPDPPPDVNVPLGASISQLPSSPQLVHPYNLERSSVGSIICDLNKYSRWALRRFQRRPHFVIDLCVSAAIRQSCSLHAHS